MVGHLGAECQRQRSLNYSSVDPLQSLVALVRVPKKTNVLILKRRNRTPSQFDIIGLDSSILSALSHTDEKQL